MAIVVGGIAHPIPKHRRKRLPELPVSIAHLFVLGQGWPHQNTTAMFARDVNKMTQYYAHFAPELATTRYAEEIWELFAAGELTVDYELTGLFEGNDENANVDSVLEEIKAVIQEEQEERERIARVTGADDDED